MLLADRGFAFLCEGVSFPIRTAGVNSHHPLVGTWEQAPNPGGGTTSVVYTIFVERDGFLIQGKDEEHEAPLAISRIRWDGETLHFTTVFPFTKHTAKHVLKAVSNGRMSHHLSCTYSDGEVFSDVEIWRKRRGRKKMK